MSSKKYLISSTLFIIFISHCTSGRARYETMIDKKVSDMQKEQKRSIYLQNKKIKESPSIHFNLRKPQYVIIHQTVQTSCEKTLKIFGNPYSKVSAHYVICKDGRVFQVVDDYLRAWHAGAGKWGNIVDMNSVSLGVELDNTGYEAFAEAQIKSLIALLQRLKEKYKIPPTNIIGHGDIAPSRKEGPNCLFPWKRLADHGLAVMPDSNLSQKVPGNVDYLKALRLIGYNVSEPKDAIRAFRRHFIGCDVPDTQSFTVEELRILEDVASKY